VVSVFVWGTDLKREPIVMNDEKLNEIFRKVQKTHFPGSLRKVKAEFYPYRSLRHSVEWNGFRIRAKVSKLFANAPNQILEVIAVILLSRVYKRQIDKHTRSLYRAYSQQLSYKRQVRKLDYSAKGKYFDLQLIYQRINNIYFSGELKVANIGWSKKRSYTRLGFYDKKRNLIVISKIFDSPAASLKVLQYLMYHEMLHIKYPEVTVNHRRRIHTRDFKQAEKQFPDFDEIQVWLKKNVQLLVGQSG
jgi:predicted metal-dependent hydrolase